MHTNYNRIKFITTTDDNTVMAHAHKNSYIVFYQQSGTTYSEDYTYTSNQGIYSRSCGAFTSDNEWFISAYLHQSVTVLKRNSGTGVYEEYQIISVGGS